MLSLSLYPHVFVGLIMYTIVRKCEFSTEKEHLARTGPEVRIHRVYYLSNIQGLRSRAAGRRPLRVRKEEWTFSRKAETKHKWRNRRLENAKRSIYSTTVQDRDDYDYDFVIIIHSPSP